MKGATVLVAGANGFLGRNLMDCLVKAGARVFAISRSVPAATSPSPIQWRQADLADLEPLRVLVREIQPDFIYHLASDSRGGREVSLVLPSFRNDVQTTVNILLAAIECPCRRVIVTASLEEPAGTELQPVPVSPYAAAKMASGMYARMFHSLYGLPVTLLRPFMTYGPYQKDFKLVPYVIQCLLRGETPTLSSGTRLIDLVYVDDVIKAFVGAATMESAVGRTIDLGSGALVPISELVEQVYTLLPGSPRPQYSELNSRANEVVRRADTAAAEQFLGWRATTPLLEGLKETVDWFRDRMRNEGRTD